MELGCWRGKKEICDYALGCILFLMDLNEADMGMNWNWNVEMLEREITTSLNVDNKHPK